MDIDNNNDKANQALDELGNLKKGAVYCLVYSIIEEDKILKEKVLYTDKMKHAEFFQNFMKLMSSLPGTHVDEEDSVIKTPNAHFSMQRLEITFSVQNPYPDGSVFDLDFSEHMMSENLGKALAVYFSETPLTHHVDFGSYRKAMHDFISGISCLFADVYDALDYVRTYVQNNEVFQIQNDFVTLCDDQNRKVEYDYVIDPSTKEVSLCAIELETTEPFISGVDVWDFEDYEPEQLEIDLKCPKAIKGIQMLVDHGQL
jgi:hypothetical protein